MVVWKWVMPALLVVLVYPVVSLAADREAVPAVIADGKPTAEEAKEAKETKASDTALFQDVSPFREEENAPGPDAGACDKLICQPCGPRWTVTADALFLQRSASRNQSLLLDPRTESDLLNSSDLTFSGAAGPRLSLIRHGLGNCDFELNYFGLDGWQARTAFPSTALPGGIGSLVVDSAILLPVTEVAFREHSRLYSSEFNLRKPIHNCVTALAGFRWVELHEKFLAQGSGLGGSFANAVNARNHLYGFQIGADARLWGHGCLRFDGFLKSGIFYNAAAQHSEFSEFSDPEEERVLSAAAHDNHPSFLGELGLIGTYQVTRHAAFRAGYQVMWIEGVALAPRQIPLNDLGAGTAGVNTSGGLFAHGATVGLEVTW